MPNVREKLRTRCAGETCRMRPASSSVSRSKRWTSSRSRRSDATSRSGRSGSAARSPRCRPEPRADDGERGLGLERAVGILQRAVERAEPANERHVLDVGIVDGSADQAFVEDLGAEVEHALAEPGAGRRPAVVHDVRRQDRHPGPGGAAMPGLEVVPDRALVDDEHVHVSWVCGGYAWSTNRAWKTSWMPGTAGFHARTHSPGVVTTRGSYKTSCTGRVLDGRP